MQFIGRSLSILAAFAVVVSATPALRKIEVASAGDANAVDALRHWLATTDADLIFVGKPITPLSPREELATTVTYCNRRIVNVCGGTCHVYTGGATCLDARGTQCLSATNNVGFCDRGGCGGSCNQLSTCGVRLDNNFCATPGTASILVSNA